MKRIRAGRGLGDSIYLRPIVEHFVRAREQVQALSDYPDVFRGTGAEVEPFGRNGVNVLAHYTAGKTNPLTTQYEDLCASAQLNVLDVPLSFAWDVVNYALVDELVSQAGDRPLIVVHGGRTPMGRTDGFGAELLPERDAFEAALEELRDCFLVRVGKGADTYPLPVSLDLNGRTSVTELLDIASACDGVVGQCSFAVPLAEVFDKPLLAVWAARGLSGKCHPYITSITPKKILSKPTSRFVVDDWPREQIREVARAFRAIR